MEYCNTGQKKKQRKGFTFEKSCGKNFLYYYRIE